MIIADLHIHSRFSRATSKDINLENLEKWARVKGLNLLGTGDFQHPKWSKELDSLEEKEGILFSKTGFPFLWQTEISLMYTQDKKGRRIHHILLAPNKDIAKQITEFLSSKGRLDYDGRPIFGFSSIELVDAMLDISKDIEIIPAHAMTPWFGIFGSNSGFNSLQECFLDKTNKINAVESGMSADPEMLWRFSWLNDKTIVSFSDLHSFWPWRIGREATVFNCDLNYKNILKAIRTKEGLDSTIEVDPNYGKYHFDGHRNCKVRLSPKESNDLEKVCPVCGKGLTIGVLNRIEELADNKEGFKPENAKLFKKIIPLSELISLSINTKQLYSKRIWEIYNNLIKEFKSEFNVLLNASEKDLGRFLKEDLIDLIIKNRKGKLKILPGYDGEYGELVFDDKQKGLDSFS